LVRAYGANFFNEMEKVAHELEKQEAAEKAADDKKKKKK